MRLLYAFLFFVGICMMPSLAQAQAPELVLSHEPVCAGDTAIIHISVPDIIPQNCGAASTLVNDSIRTANVGTDSTTNSGTIYPAPYGNWYKNARHRMLYRASDLYAAGFQGGKILSLGFEVTALNGSTQIYKNYRLAMKCTNDSVAPSDFNDSLGWTEVFTPKNVFVNVGINTHQLDVPFHWDGVSNLYVEVCFDNLADPSYTYNCSSPYTTKSYAAVIYDRNDITALCGAIPPFPINLNDLPNIIFTYGGGDVDPNRFSISFNPSNQVINPGLNPLFLPGASSTLDVTVLDNVSGLSTTQSLNINYSSAPLPISFTALDSLFCPNEAPITLQASPLGGLWTGSPALSSAGTFDPSVAGPGIIQATYQVAFGTVCQNSASINLEVGPPQDPTISTSNPLQLCNTDQPFTLALNTPGGTWSSFIVDSLNTVSPAALQIGTYSLIYSFNDYCYVADTLDVSILAGPDFYIDPTPAFCNGMASFNMSYTEVGFNLQTVYWGGDIISDSLTGTVNTTLGVVGPNMVTLTGIAFNGCKLTDTAYVDMYLPQLVITATDSTINQGESTTLVVFGASSWAWSNGQSTTSITVNPSSTTTYTCIATLPNGCSDTLSLTINVIDNTGFDEQGYSNFGIALRPGLTTDQSNLSISGGISGTYQVLVYSMNGSQMEQLSISNREPVEIGGTYAPGIYIIRVIAPDGGSRMQRLIKQ